MDYSVFRITCPEQWREIFVAECAELGFDMMQETDQGVEAFVSSELQQSLSTSDLMTRYKTVPGLKAEWDVVKSVNWNEEWEKNYDPVVIDQRCIIRAPFHPPQNEYEWEVIIQPRMSFGTGHHPTTTGMVRAMLDLKLHGESLLDAGCGTGVLAILAELKGATRIDAYDISQLCMENSLDNIHLNSCSSIRLQTGTISEVDLSPPYDYIFANINKNTLLQEIPDFAAHLGAEGQLYVSGFFETDKDDILRLGSENGLTLIYDSPEQHWAILGLVKAG